MTDEIFNGTAIFGDGTKIIFKLKDEYGNAVTKAMFQNGKPDYDDDGLINGKELVWDHIHDKHNPMKYGWVMVSNPVLKDTDGDGLNDKEDPTPLNYTILGKDRIIDDQYSDYKIDINGEKTFMKDIPFGSVGNIADNGCGIIAAYNVMLLKNPDIQFIDVKNDIENMGGAFIGGFFGTKPSILQQYLEKYFEKVMSSNIAFGPISEPGYWGIFNNADAVIIWIENNEDNIYDGFHYIAGINLHDGKNRFDFYNTYDNCKGISIQNFINKIYKGNGRSVSIYAVYI